MKAQTPLKQNLKTSESKLANNHSEERVAWCCAPPSNPCCPELKLLSDKTYQITDDYGDSIKLTESSMQDLLKKVSDYLQ